VEFFTRELRVTGDVRIEFFHSTTTQRMFSLAFNVLFENSDARNRLVFKKSDLERACLDTTHLHFKNNFVLEIFLLTEEVQQEMRRGSFSSGAMPAAITKYRHEKRGTLPPLNPEGGRSTWAVSGPPSKAGFAASSSPSLASPGAGANLHTIFARRQATSARPSSMDLSQARSGSSMTRSDFSGTPAPTPGQDKKEAPTKRPSSVHLPSLKTRTAKRDLIIPPKPPPVPPGSVRRTYFSYQRAETEHIVPGPAPTPTSRSPIPFDLPAVPPTPQESLCPICEQSLRRGVTIEIFIDTTIHVDCMKCGTCGRSLQGENDQSVLHDGKITCSSCTKEYVKPN
jgi:hypothetical protein